MVRCGPGILGHVSLQDHPGQPAATTDLTTHQIAVIVCVPCRTLSRLAAAVEREDADAQKALRKLRPSVKRVYRLGRGTRWRWALETLPSPRDTETSDHIVERAREE